MTPVISPPEPAPDPAPGNVERFFGDSLLVTLTRGKLVFVRDERGAGTTTYRRGPRPAR